MKIVILGILSFIFFTSSSQIKKINFAQIQSEFITPSDSNNIWCYWYWIGDDISKEGITKDLEAMKEVGIGTAFIGNINPDGENGKVPVLSEEWWDCMVFAVEEGKRLGVDIGSFNCPGWSMSGGPWISAEKSMRHLVYSETKITGGGKINIKLDKPKSIFQDVSVLAFPKNEKEEVYLDNSNSKIIATPAIKNVTSLLDRNTSKSADFSQQKHILNIQSKKPFTARSITLYSGNNDLVVNCELQALVDNEYITVRKFVFDRRDYDGRVGPMPYGPLSISFPAVKSSLFKLICSDIKAFESYGSNVQKATGFSEIVISEAAVIEDYLGKTLGRMHPTPQPTPDSYSWELHPKLLNKKLLIEKNEILDISEKMDKEGTLVWDAPEGEWTIMRLGLTPTGVKNNPAAPQGTGYEVDKANSELIRFHFNQFIGQFLNRIPEKSKSAFKYVIADSYEVGSENWTDGFEQVFEARYGYNPKKYLPVFSGRIVGSIQESDRFLWDMRRAMADNIAYDYVRGLRQVANENGLKLWLENYGHWGFPSEFLMYGGQSDFIGGEYWNEGTLGDIECKAASSAVHTYGKKITSAECFTTSQRTYVRHPAMLKKRGDWSLTEGINQHVLSVYIHQPDDNRIPGINAWFGTEFNRHNTWFKQGKAHLTYLRRAQFLLQQGNYVADICYFIGEDAPIMTGATIPELPKGYSFDFINAEVILNRMSVEDGKLVLPDGMSYHMMILPPLETMRPEVLSKIEQLVKDGAIIYGQAPKSSPSLQNYPQCDEQVKSLAATLWAGKNRIKFYGKGAVIDGGALQDAFDYFNIEKDVRIKHDVLWTHRSMQGMDIYFLTNQSGQEININPSFRVGGMKPQLWDAVTGEMRMLNDYVVKDGRTIIPLKMEPDRSWFVVFSNESNELIRKGYVSNSPEYVTIQTLNKPWKINFHNKQIASKEISSTELFDWTKSKFDWLKYFSGTANYTTTFNFKRNKSKDIYLDLGKVGIIATVMLNGIEVGTTWIEPHRLNITKFVKEGENILEIEVVNVWRNRITGDKKLKEGQRTTWLLVDDITKEEELIPSGLIGNVVIQSIK